MRFRLESNGLTREQVVTCTTAESGLEAPEEYFVELEVYEDMYGKANQEDIVFDDPDGTGCLKAGVTLVIIFEQSCQCVFELYILYKYARTRSFRHLV